MVPRFCDHLVARHADAVVLDGERARVVVELDGDARLAHLLGHVLAGELEEARLVERVRGVRDRARGGRPPCACRAS